MRGSWRLWATLIALIVLHYLLHLGIGIGREAPDLLVLALLLAAREVRMGTAAALGFGLGLLEDAFSLLAFGASTVALTLVGTLGARTRDLFVGDSAFFVICYLFVGKWVRDLVFWVVLGDRLRPPFVQEMLVQASLAAVYVAGVGLVLMWVTGNWWESSR